jgi:predicted RND superfamily exporter protein
LSALSSKTFSATRVIWAGWIIAAAIGAVGVRNLRIHNSMDAWMPDLAATGAYSSYLVIGMSANQADAIAVAGRLRGLSSVQFCLDPASVTTMQRVTGITPDNFVIGIDPSYRGIFCFRRSSASEQQFRDQVETALNDFAAPGTFAIGGPVVFQQAMDEWSQYRLALILGSILVVGGFLLYLITGSARIAVIAIAAISCSQLIFVGALGWLRIPLDMSLALVPPMMMGMGFSYTAHRALRRQILSVLIVCGLAAAAGIGSFITAELRPVRHFAVAGVPGLLLVWLAAVTLVDPDAPARRRRIHWLRAMRNLCFAAVTRSAWIIIAIALLITVIGCVLAPRIRVAANPLNFFPVTSRIYSDFQTLNHRLTGMLPSQVVVRGGADPRSMLASRPGMRKIIDVTPWVGGSSARTYWCLADDDEVIAISGHLPDWKDWARTHHATIEWHGVAAQISRSGGSIFTTAAQSLPFMLLLIALIIAIRIRRFRAVLIGTWVAVLPVAALIVIVVASGWELGPVTMMIGSITIGVAVDDVLHLLTTYRRRRTLAKTMIECWKPCVGSSIATASCFALFTLSPFGPTHQFGQMMAIATCLGMCANQLVLSAAIS